MTAFSVVGQPLAEQALQGVEARHDNVLGAIAVKVCQCRGPKHHAAGRHAARVARSLGGSDEAGPSAPSAEATRACAVDGWLLAMAAGLSAR